MSMKVPDIVRQTKETLQNGYSVIIGLQTTGEVGPAFSETVLMEITLFLSLKCLRKFDINRINLSSISCEM